MFQRLAISTIFLFVFFIPFNTAYPGGLIGDVLKWTGDRTGVRPLRDLGENADAEHRRIKENNPAYKRIEEDVSEAVKRPFTVACTIPYQTLTNAVIARCSNWGGRLDDQHIIQQAKQSLINAGIFAPHEFNGVQIRWCPLSGAHGMAPDRGKIYLDTSAKNKNRNALAALLAHEMKHIQQYRRMGTDRFKCIYSEKYIGCGGCQDRGHTLEREAYDFEDNVYNRLASYSPPAYSQPSYGYNSAHTYSTYGSGINNMNPTVCVTQMGSCYITYNLVGARVGDMCNCNGIVGIAR